MIYIAHRGNLFGPNPERENRLDYIQGAIDGGFQVEVDLWVIDGEWFFGHDNPQYRVTYEWLFDRYNDLWIHCKNLAALRACLDRPALHCFWHEKDAYAITSDGWIWANTGQPINRQVIVVDLDGERVFDNANDYLHCGVCTDYPLKSRAAHSV